MQFRHFLIKHIRQEADIVLVGQKRASNLDTFFICLILSEDSGLRVERGKVKCRHFLVELFRKEEDVVVEGLEPTNSSKIKLRWNLVREGTQSFEGPSTLTPVFSV